MNFDFLKPIAQLAPLCKACETAEALVSIAPAQSCVSSRSALEFIVKLIYRSIYRNAYSTSSLFEMMSDQAFVSRIGDEGLLTAMHSVRKIGNACAHGGEVSAAVACKTLEQLQFVVGEFCLTLRLVDDYPVFVSPLEKPAAKKTVEPAAPDVAPRAAAAQSLPKAGGCEPSAEVIAEFGETLRRTKFSTAKLRDEAENKLLFANACLREAHWKIASVSNQLVPEAACFDIVLDDGSKVDAVLAGRDGRPLAVIDRRAASNPVVSRKAVLHAADELEKKFGYRPTAYYFSGYHLICIDPLGFPPRRVFGIHELDELDLLRKRAKDRRGIADPAIDDNITNRDYQKQAITAACRAFEANRRRSLIVMATGTGKTRVAISLVDVLTKANWVKNVLFLADRISLVRQAHKNFNKLLPNLTTSIFTGSSNNRDKSARVVFSTYQTMIGLVDGDVREFGVGRFDLIIVDEAHRSLFSKYGRLFDYFDALMVGLTATPRCEEAKSTYEVFQIESGIPDFTYELEDAVDDGYLVGFDVLDLTTEQLRQGICYDDLTDEQKKEIEEQLQWGDDDGGVSRVDGSGHIIDSRIFNIQTINAMLRNLMDRGIKIDAGDKLGKTIIFTKNHYEATIVVQQFNKLYPACGPDFCKLIDSSVEGSQGLIDSLGERDKYPQIAVSVDMLDTGVDIPDAVNLVFFRGVRSKIKFLQMVGRGTRLSPDLFGPGMDKKGFLAFDYYDNFRFFGTHQSWKVDTGVPDQIDDGNKVWSQSTYVNRLRLTLLWQLQDKGNLSGFEARCEKELRVFFEGSVASLPNDAIEVDRNLAYVNKFRTDGAFEHLTSADVDTLTDRVLPFFPSEPAPPRVKSFDALMLKIETECESRIQDGEDPHKIRYGFKSVEREFTERMNALQKLMSIPQVRRQEKLIHDMIDGAYLLDNYTLERAEDVRLKLRELMQYIPEEQKYYVIDLPDKLIDGGKQEGIAKPRSYQERVSEYLADESNVALLKLRTLEPLAADEFATLRADFTQKLGSVADYAAWSGSSDFSLAFIRKQVGIAPEAIQTKAGHILSDPALTDNQKAFFDQIVSYVMANGDIQAMTLQKPPFIKTNPAKLFGPAKLQKIKDLINLLHDPVKQVGN